MMAELEEAEEVVKGLWKGEEGEAETSGGDECVELGVEVEMRVGCCRRRG